ncbi:gag-pol polyprotein [Tanacetum coccineum]
MFIHNNSTVPKLQTTKDLQGDALLHYDAEIELMNMIILSIPNDIYNCVDACTSAKDMWKRVERLMRGTIQNKVDRETRFTNEFAQFVAEPGESLLMNDLERNDMHFPIVTINTKFLNSLQPEWLKYVTQVRLAKRLTVDTFDDLFYYLQRFEKLVNVSRAKKLEKSHDPLALVAHTGSSSRNTSSYYVTHLTSVVDYDDEYQQDNVHTNSEDPLASAMLLLTRAITQKFSTPTNNHLRTSSNTRNQAIIQEDRVNIQSRNSDNAGRNNRRAYVQEEIIKGSNAPNETRNVQRTLRTSSLGNTSTVQCYNYSGKGHYARNCPKPRVRDSKYFMEQMLLAKQDEAGVILTDKQNDFLFADASRMEEIEELSPNICLMARIQPADNTSDAGASYDSAFISKVQSSSNNENEEQMYPTHTKIINSTIGDDKLTAILYLIHPMGMLIVAVVHIVMWIVDSGCSKHMTGDRSLLRNFIEKFMGTVRFVGQFCDGDLEVAFRSKTLLCAYSGSLCYPTNNRDDLGKMKPKADIGVFIGYSETSRGFRIYNRHTKRIMETINVKFDELIAMASKHDCLEPEFQRFINHNSSAETMNTLSKEDLDNLFGPMYEEYFDKKFSDTPINSFVSYNPPSHEEIESSTTALEPSNVQNFHQVQPSTHIWTKYHPLNQVIGDPSKPIMTRQRLHTDSERLQVWQLVPRPEGKNIIALKWLWKNKCDAENIVVRNKTRLVAKGYRQEEGIDF